MAFTFLGKSQASMLFMDFKHKLKRLNSKLYVRENEPTKLEGLLHAGIYLKEVVQEGLKAESKGRGFAAVEKYYAALESGQLDKYLCGMCLEYIPEYDIFNANYTKIAIPGWRTLLLRLVQAKACTLDEARKAFGVAGLGESDYDKMSYFQKMQFAKKLDLGEGDA